MPEYHIIREQWDPGLQKTLLTIGDERGMELTTTVRNIYLRKSIAFNIVRGDLHRFFELLEAEVWVEAPQSNCGATIGRT